MLGTPTWANKAIGVPNATPDAVFAGEVTTVTITAQVAVDPNLIVRSVNLVGLDSMGRATGTVAPMYDDGTHGDVLPGDQTFTAQVTLAPNQATSLTYEVTAAYSGSLLRAKSPAFTVVAVVKPSIAEVNTALSIPDLGVNYYLSQKSLVGDDVARTNLVAFLLQQPGVVSAAVGPDGYTIGIQYASGLESAISTGPDGTSGGGGRAISLPSILDIRMPLFQSAARMRNLNSTPAEGPTVNYSGNAKAIVLAPFYDAFTHDAGSDASGPVAQYLSATYGGQPLYLKNADASVDAFERLRTYGTIFINTHGGVLPGGAVDLSTGETVSDSQGLISDLHLLLQYSRGFIIPLTNSSYPNVQYWAIKPSFIDAYAGGGYPNSLVCLSACSGVNNNTMWNAFQRHGAKTLFGWDNTVATVSTNAATSSLFQTLTDSDKIAADRTAQKAYDSLGALITDPYGYTDDNYVKSGGTHAVFKLKGDPNISLIDDSVVNGDFETGDFTGWTTDTAIGYDKVTPGEDLDGHYSARIGRWDEPYTAFGGLNGPYVPGDEPDGQDYIYQDIDLPNDDSSPTLSFDYDVKTYDGASYDWFDADVIDSDTGEILATLVNHVGGIILGSPSNWGIYSTTGRQHVTANLTSFKGERIRLFFGVTQDGYGDQTAAYVDNVSIKP